MVSQERIDKYLEDAWSSCLRCGSIDIHGGYVEIDGKEASQEVTCNECEYSWTDIYTLSGVDIQGQETLGPDYDEWKAAVAAGTTHLGYWDWRKNGKN